MDDLTPSTIHKENANVEKSWSYWEIWAIIVIEFFKAHQKYCSWTLELLQKDSGQEDYESCYACARTHEYLPIIMQAQGCWNLSNREQQHQK